VVPFDNSASTSYDSKFPETAFAKSTFQQTLRFPPPFLSNAPQKNPAFNRALSNLLSHENNLDPETQNKFLEVLAVKPHSSQSIRKIFQNCRGKRVVLQHQPKPEPPPPNPEQHIPFNQAPLIGCLDSAQHKSLKCIQKNYQGLCEIICNYVLTNDLLGQGNDVDFLVNRIQPENLNQINIKKSHILNIYGIFRKAIAFLFGIYPNNIFSFRAQWKLVEEITVTKNKRLHSLFGDREASVTEVEKHVNRPLLIRKLNSLADGETLKLETIEKTWCSFGGHATLIKKISNGNYIFFDPNEGETRNLSFDQLCEKIDDQLDRWGSDLFFTRGEDFKNRMPKN
jgi:hypothetical protein